MGEQQGGEKRGRQGGAILRGVWNPSAMQYTYHHARMPAPTHTNHLPTPSPAPPDR